MDLSKFLKDNPLISKPDLAIAMYPDKPKSAKSKLTNKLLNLKAGNGKQRVTPKDANLAQKALDDLAESIRVNRITVDEADRIKKL